MRRNWLTRRFTGSKATHRKRHPFGNRQPHRRLRFEAVEERALLTTLSVDIGDASCGDAGDDLYCQIHEAEAVAVPGDKIQVASGTYQPVEIDVDGITIQEAKENANPVIDASGTDVGVLLTASGVTIKGLHVQNADEVGFHLSATGSNTLTGNTASDNGRHGFLLSGSDGNRLTGNTASGSGVDGFFLNSSSGNTLSGNTASDNGRHGFRLSLSNGNTLSGNTARKNAGWGFLVDAVLDNIFEDNECKQNGLGGSDPPGIC